MISRERARRTQRRRPDLTAEAGCCPGLGQSRMRRKVTVETLKQFMDGLAAAARSPGKVILQEGQLRCYWDFESR
jgi:hypothetical protein